MTTAPSTILLVDDDKTTRYVLRRWLTHLNVHSYILEAENGKQALELVHEYCQTPQSPQSLLVLLDLEMPVLNGLEFLTQQQQLSPACQQAMSVIVLCAAPDRAEAAQARALAADLRAKPLDIMQIEALVRQYLPTALPTPA